MFTQKDLDTEAALLAASVGGHLNRIDKMMDQQNGLSSNRINLQNFISAAQGKQVYTDLRDPANRGYISEETVQSLVPDTSEFSKPSISGNIDVKLTDENNSPQVSGPVIMKSKKEISKSTAMIESSVNASEDTLSKMEKELIAIHNLLERINANLTKMSGMLGKVFCSFTEKEKLNSEK